VLANKLDARLDWTKTQQQVNGIAVAVGGSPVAADSEQVKLTLESLKLAGLIKDVVHDESGFRVVMPEPAAARPKAAAAKASRASQAWDKTGIKPTKTPRVKHPVA
jgi:predicted exporter